MPDPIPSPAISRDGLDLDATEVHCRHSYLVSAATALGLIAMVRRLQTAVQHHYNQRGDSRCWLDDFKLYHDALGIEADPYITAMPPEPDAEESCRRYRQQRQCPSVAGTYPMPGGMTIQQLSDEVARLKGLPGARPHRITVSSARSSRRALEAARAITSSASTARRSWYRRGT